MHEKRPIITTDQETVAVYDVAAEAYVAKYESLGARTEDIARGFALCESNNRSIVLEIGCANGRDAQHIIERTENYVGIDISQAMIGLAREKLPGVTFIYSDVLSYDFPGNTDIIFAFASLLHLPKEGLQKVFKKSATALAGGGVLYISLKRKEAYSDALEEDAFGKRHFYYYDYATLIAIAPPTLQVVYHDEQHHGSADWITVVFKKL